METPTGLAMASLKELVRYVEDKKHFVVKYPTQRSIPDKPTQTRTVLGARQRKSTSNKCILFRNHLIKSWSSPQSNMPLLGGDAEIYGLVNAAGMAPGHQSMITDMRMEAAIRVWMDSTASLGIVARQNLGKLRNISAHCEWI